MNNSNDLKNLTISSDKTMSDAMHKLNENIRGICFITNNNVLVGLITDGDIRRALLNDFTKESLIESFMNKNFISLSSSASSGEIKKKLSNKIKYIPLINEKKELVNYASFENFRTIPVMEPKLSTNASLYVQECIDTNWISSKGKFVNKFEDEFSKIHNNQKALSVSNGTVALHLSLVALGIGPGDEVIVPNFTFASSINAVLHAGATPVIVDIELETWCLDPNKIENSINSKTKAVMPVHLYGMPCKIEEIISIAKKHGIFVIEDSAEAVGSKWKKRPVGTFGDIGTFSFFGNKTITTGEGGMIIFKDDKIYEKAKILRDHGMSLNKKYWHEHVGYNYRMTNLQAALGYSQMEQFSEIIDKKRKIAGRYFENLKNNQHIEQFPRDNENAFHSYWLYTIKLKEEVDRDRVIAKLLDKGIEARPVFYPLNQMPIYSSYSKMGSYEVSNNISLHALSLPSSLNLDHAQVDYVCSNLNKLIS